METLSNKRPDNASCFCFGKFSSRQVICTRLQVICTRLSNSLTLHLRKNSLSLKKDPFFHFTKHHKKKNRSLRRRLRRAPLLSAQRAFFFPRLVPPAAGLTTLSAEGISQIRGDVSFSRLEFSRRPMRRDALGDGSGAAPSGAPPLLPPLPALPMPPPPLVDCTT